MHWTQNVGVIKRDWQHLWTEQMGHVSGRNPEGSLNFNVSFITYATLEACLQ